MISGTPRAKLPSSGAAVSRVNSGIAMPSFFDPPWVTLRKTSTPWECEVRGRRQHAGPSREERQASRTEPARHRPCPRQPGWNVEPEVHLQDVAWNSRGSGGKGLASVTARSADWS